MGREGDRESILGKCQGGHGCINHVNNSKCIILLYYHFTNHHHQILHENHVMMITVLVKYG